MGTGRADHHAAVAHGVEYLSGELAVGLSSGAAHEFHAEQQSPAAHG